MEKFKSLGKIQQGCLIIVGLFVLCGVVGMLMGDPNADTTSDAGLPPSSDESSADAPAGEDPEVEAPATEAPVVEEPTDIPGIGDAVTLGDWTWTLSEAYNMGQEIKSNNQFIDPMTTSGTFIYVKVNVARGGSDAGFIQAPKLLGEGDVEFDHSSDAIFFLDETCTLEEVNPGLSRDCEWIFEVPNDQVFLRVTDGNIFGGEQAFIHLGSE